MVLQHISQCAGTFIISRPIFYADGFLYCYGEKNEMALVAANPKEYIEKGRFEVPSGDQPTWAHPVVANGRMYLRDMQRLTCYDVKTK